MDACTFLFSAAELPAEWDAFVAQHPLGWISHLSVWNTILERSFPYVSGFWLIRRCNGRIDAGVPVYRVKSLWRRAALVSIPFATLAHPLADGEDPLKALLGRIMQLSIRERVRYLEIRAMDRLPIPAAAGKIALCRGFVQHYLELDSPAESLFRRFDRSCVRQRIARAESSGMRLRVAATEEDFLAFYRLCLLTRKRLGLLPMPVAFVRNLWKELLTNGNSRIFLADLHGGAIAGLLVLKYGRRVSAEMLGYDPRYRSVSPNHFLLWNAIKEAVREGYQVFDFGRTGRDNADLFRFKSRWGTRTAEMPIYYLNGLPSTAWEAAQKTRIWETAIGHLPGRALMMLSPFAYRFRA